MPRTKHPGSASPRVGLSSPLAPGPFESPKTRELKRDRRCQVHSDPYGLPNWGRPLKGRVNSAPANDNVNTNGAVSVNSYPAEKKTVGTFRVLNAWNHETECSMSKPGLDGAHAHHHAAASDIAWRHYWLTNVMIDGGRFGPARLARREMPARKESLSRRLYKLRRMRAILNVRG
jgi:hypothetical protein